MTRGRKPTPTSLKVLNGNPGKRPLNANEPYAEPGLPEIPSHLSESARNAWEKLAPMLESSGVATQLDGVAFELLCSAYGSYLENAAKVAKYGAVFIEAREGSTIPETKYSPYYRIMTEQWDQVRRMLTEFGLTPSARARVQRVEPENNDKAAKFFGATG